MFNKLLCAAANRQLTVSSNVYQALVCTSKQAIRQADNDSLRAVQGLDYRRVLRVLFNMSCGIQRVEALLDERLQVERFQAADEHDMLLLRVLWIAIIIVVFASQSRLSSRSHNKGSTWHHIKMSIYQDG